MKIKILIIISLATLSFSIKAADKQQMIEESQLAIKTFSTELKSKLQQGMKKGGPVTAIQVCHTTAANIAQLVSKQYGWNIGRTSLKVRNTKNTPDNFEKQALENFAQRQAAGEDVGKMYQAEIIEKDGKHTFRYLQTIPTGAICLSCHGEKIDAPVAAQLDKLYPHDQARGFKIGDIRGAFTIIRAID
jgi:uncharacterized protein DUF3365